MMLGEGLRVVEANNTEQLGLQFNIDIIDEALYAASRRLGDGCR